jgi:hypothetical protein
VVFLTLSAFTFILTSGAIVFGGTCDAILCVTQGSSVPTVLIVISISAFSADLSITFTSTALLSTRFTLAFVQEIVILAPGANVGGFRVAVNAMFDFISFTRVTLRSTLFIFIFFQVKLVTAFGTFPEPLRIIALHAVFGGNFRAQTARII